MLSGAKEGFGRGKVGENMDAIEFEKLIRHLIASYGPNGKQIVIQFDNATCHSRRSDRWLSRQEVQEGRLVKG